MLTRHELKNKATQAEAAIHRAVLANKNIVTDKAMLDGFKYGEFVLSTVRSWKDCWDLMDPAMKLDSIESLIKALDNDSSL